MTQFHVGMKVVCVDDQWHDVGWQTLNGIACPLETNRVYTIEDIMVAYGQYREVEGREVEVLVLREVKNPALDQQDGFASKRFRPAHENRMEELRSLLVTPPSKAKTKKQVTA